MLSRPLLCCRRLRVASLLASVLLASALAPCAALAGGLPPHVQAALARAHIGSDSVALLVVDAQGAHAPRLAHRTQVAMNPASVMKLVTTYAALDLLGPAYVWNTPVYVDGPVLGGSLQGNVYIKGTGDPKLVLERMWMLLRRLQGLGIHHIAGDIVLDHSAFALDESDPGRFDGEPLRPYNAAPDALLLNYRSLLLTFTPDPSSGTALVQLDPPLHGVQLQGSVPLVVGGVGGDCVDYRAALQADFSDANRIRFGGSYRASCGERVWPVAYAEPASYAPRALLGLWLEMGGQIDGSVHWGQLPARLAAVAPRFTLSSPPLAEIVRDINKYSNNVMAQQLFLTLGLQEGVGSFASSRAALERWWGERLADTEAPVLENGSGLSRMERISAQALGRLLQLAWRSGHMAELMASLPINGVDGTLQRNAAARSSAHLKTGSLSNVLARAGYVDGQSGKRYVLVALINHPQAASEAARSAIDALVDWTARD